MVYACKTFTICTCTVKMSSNLKVVLPGDAVSLQPSCSVGPGLQASREHPDSAVVSVAGLLRATDPQGGTKKKKTWVDYSAKRYVPVRGERVLGVVKATGRCHRVDIGAAVPAVLPELAFEGATKRNKPNLQVGEVVYARVSRAHRDMEAELSCMDGSGKASGLGPLPVAGYLVQHCSIGLARKLLSPDCAVLNALGEYFKFELTVGLNGRLWVDSRSPAHTIVVSNIILHSEYLSPKHCREVVSEAAQRL